MCMFVLLYAPPNAIGCTRLGLRERRTVIHKSAGQQSQKIVGWGADSLNLLFSNRTECVMHIVPFFITLVL